MLTKTIYNLQDYIHGDYNRDNLARLHLYVTPTTTQMLC